MVSESVVHDDGGDAPYQRAHKSQLLCEAPALESRFVVRNFTFGSKTVVFFRLFDVRGGSGNTQRQRQRQHSNIWAKLGLKSD